MRRVCERVRFGRAAKILKVHPPNGDVAEAGWLQVEGERRPIHPEQGTINFGFWKHYDPQPGHMLVISDSGMCQTCDEAWFDRYYREVSEFLFRSANQAIKLYQCHKIVAAAKIHGVGWPCNDLKGWLRLSPDPNVKTYVPPDYLWEKHAPSVGDYLVIYADGYTSISPAEAFESGYSEIMDQV